MPKLTSFTFQSIDGFYKGVADDVSWNRQGPEEVAFAEAQIARGQVLVFGRRTYEHMAAFWPTAEAAAYLPAIAHGMNAAQKIVVSTGLRDAPWGPARILGGDATETMRALKAADGPDMTILGSGVLVASLAAQGLIDALEILIYPVAIGAGTPLFAGIGRHLDFTLIGHRVFASGTVLLAYAPRNRST